MGNIAGWMLLDTKLFLSSCNHLYEEIRVVGGNYMFWGDQMVRVCSIAQGDELYEINKTDIMAACLKKETSSIDESTVILTW